MPTTTDAGQRPRGEGESTVVDALGHGLDSGFAVLFRAYRGVLFSSALRISGDRTDAEDITAEVFLRAYRALLTYDPARIATLRLRPWLLAILVNVWRNRLRSTNRRVALVLREVPPERPDCGAGIEPIAERRETGRKLALLLALLPEPQRVAVVLRHVSGLSIAEIADVLGCREGTAKSHVSRGLSRLRSLWKGEGGS